MIDQPDYSLETEKQITKKISSLVGVETFKPGLERLRPLFDYFQGEIRKRNIKIVTVGGTNGKGETCFYLSQYLEKSQKKWALWSSPHVLSVRERFFSNNSLISYDHLSTLLEDNKELKDELSYYEFLFYIFWKFVLKDPALEIVILEVGLGGRFDAVNLFDADYTSIVSVSYTHLTLPTTPYV